MKNNILIIIMLGAAFIGGFYGSKIIDPVEKEQSFTGLKGIENFFNGTKEQNARIRTFYYGNMDCIHSGEDALPNKTISSDACLPIFRQHQRCKQIAGEELCIPMGKLLFHKDFGPIPDKNSRYLFELDAKTFSGTTLKGEVLKGQGIAVEIEAYYTANNGENVQILKESLVKGEKEPFNIDPWNSESLKLQDEKRNLKTMILKISPLSEGVSLRYELKF